MGAGAGTRAESQRRILGFRQQIELRGQQGDNEPQFSVLYLLLRAAERRDSGNYTFTDLAQVTVTYWLHGSWTHRH